MLKLLQILCTYIKAGFTLAILSAILIVFLTDANESTRTQKWSHFSVVNNSTFFACHSFRSHLPGGEKSLTELLVWTRHQYISHNILILEACNPLSSSYLQPFFL